MKPVLLCLIVCCQLLWQSSYAMEPALSYKVVNSSRGNSQAPIQMQYQYHGEMAVAEPVRLQLIFTLLQTGRLSLQFNPVDAAELSLPDQLSYVIDDQGQVTVDIMVTPLKPGMHYIKFFATVESLNNNQAHSIAKAFVVPLTVRSAQINSTEPATTKPAKIILRAR